MDPYHISNYIVKSVIPSISIYLGSVLNIFCRDTVLAIESKSWSFAPPEKYRRKGPIFAFSSQNTIKDIGQKSDIKRTLWKKSFGQSCALQFFCLFIPFFARFSKVYRTILVTCVFWTLCFGPRIFTKIVCTLKNVPAFLGHSLQ